METADRATDLVARAGEEIAAAHEGASDNRQRLHLERELGPAEREMLGLLQGGLTSSELLDKTFAPMPWLEPDLIPGEGLTVLGAKMGMGKSYFLLQLGVALSTGTPFLGRETKRQGVLFIALEDSERRIHARLNQLGAIGTDRLLIYTRWRKGKQALEDLRLLLKCRPEIKVVIIDPIVKFIDLLDFNDYGGAYGALGPIKDALDARHVAGIFSHHCKKSVAELDAFDDLLGSTGWGASCDTRLVLRRQRGSDEGTLVAGGRDVLHSESAILFDGGRGWTYQGAAEDVRMSDERKEILDLLREETALSAAEIAKRLEKNYNTTRNLLTKLHEAGKVIRDATDSRKWRSTVVTVVTAEPKPATVTTLTTPTTHTIPTTRERGEEGDLSLFPPPTEHDDPSLWGAEEAVGLLAASGGAP
jgi:hypothetical protein